MAKLFCSRVTSNPYKEDLITEITEKVFQIDGYQVAERLLEGIPFIIYFDKNIVTEVTIDDPYYKKYLEDNLNSKKWYDAVRKYAEDILRNGDEVDVPLFIKEKYFKNGINISFITP